VALAAYPTTVATVAAAEIIMVELLAPVTIALDLAAAAMAVAAVALVIIPHIHSVLLAVAVDHATSLAEVVFTRVAAAVHAASQTLMLVQTVQSY
jgi:BioD-like phosphotransacetylase family protein